MRMGKQNLREARPNVLLRLSDRQELNDHRRGFPLVLIRVVLEHRAPHGLKENYLSAQVDAVHHEPLTVRRFDSRFVVGTHV